VMDAIEWLHQNAFLRAERRPGYPPTLYLLNEDGTGNEYVHPAKREFYIQLPASFWTRGWIGILSGAAVALLLICFDQTYNPHGENAESYWLSPRRAKELYGFSPDTWLKARKELALHGIVDVDYDSVNVDPFAVIRRRNIYYPQLGRLSGDPSP
jgi:hypothetical protein